MRTSSDVGALPPLKAGAAIVAGLPVFGYLHWALRTTRIRAVRETTIDAPVIVYAWHQNTYLTYLLTRRVAELGRLRWLTHDRFRALFDALPPTRWGMPVFVFTLGAPGARQIVEAFPERLLIFPDSGGPYFQLKPGFIKIARATGARLVPLAMTGTRCVELGPMRHRVPLPGGEIRFAVGDPVEPELAACQHALEELTRRL